MAKNPLGGTSDEEMIRTTGEIINTLTKDSSIMEGIFTLFPNLQKIQAIHDRYLTLFKEVLGGNSEKEAELQAIRREVNTQLVLLRGIAVLAGSQDPTIPQRLGVVHQQPVSKRASGQLASPDNFRIIYEGHKMVGRANAVKGARSYEVWGCEDDPIADANWRHLTTSCKVNRIELTGLPPGKNYYFRIRAISTSGNGPWSNFVNMMTI